ncbi:unnamed protein product [Closterium sp. NIES-65]|nr:unnamed protein product [Closterium sp. NIES-65]
MLYNATVTSVSAIATGINKAYQTYTDYYERDQIEALKKSGKRPADNLYLVLQRFQYLCMAGYNNEVAAAAQKAAAKLTAGEKSSVAHETLLLLCRVLSSVSQRYGEQSGQGWGLQDFLNSSRMGKDHFDRDQLVIDFYFAILFVQDVCGGPGPQFEQAIREATGRLVEGDKYVGEGGGFSGGGAAFGGASSSVPSYAAVPSASALPSDQDPKCPVARKKVMKVVQVPSRQEEGDEGGAGAIAGRPQDVGEGGGFFGSGAAFGGASSSVPSYAAVPSANALPSDQDPKIFKNTLQYEGVLLRILKNTLQYEGVLLRILKNTLQYEGVLLRILKNTLQYEGVLLRIFKNTLQYEGVLLRILKNTLQYEGVLTLLALYSLLPLGLTIASIHPVLCLCSVGQCSTYLPIKALSELLLFVSYDVRERKKAMKVVQVLSQGVRKAAEDADGRKQRSLKEAEDMLRPPSHAITYTPWLSPFLPTPSSSFSLFLFSFSPLFPAPLPIARKKAMKVVQVLSQAEESDEGGTGAVTSCAQGSRKKAMKVAQVLSQAVRKAAEDADGRKQRSLKEAEDMLRLPSHAVLSQAVRKAAEDADGRKQCSLKDAEDMLQLPSHASTHTPRLSPCPPTPCPSSSLFLFFLSPPSPPPSHPTCLARKKAMKVVQVLSQAVRKAAEDADGRKQRSLKEAEDMLRRENEKAAAAAGVAYAGPPAKPLSSFGGGASAAAPVGGYGSAGGMAAKPSSVSNWSGGSGAAAAAPSPWGGGGGSALGGPVGGTMGGGAGGSVWGGGGSASVGGGGGFGGGSGGGGGGWGGSASTGGGGGAWGAGGGQAGGSAGGWGGTTGGSTTGGSSGWGTGTGGSLI